MQKTIEAPVFVEYSPGLQSVHVAADNEVDPGGPIFPAAHIVPAQALSPTPFLPSPLYVPGAQGAGSGHCSPIRNQSVSQ